MLNLKKINIWFLNAGKKIVKYRFINIGIFMLLLVASFIGLKYIEIDASQDNWLLEDDPLLIAKDRIEEIFGNHDFGAVYIEVENVFTPQILQKIRELGKELEDEVPYVDDILSLTDFEFTLGNEEGMEIIDLVPDSVPKEKTELEKIKSLALSKESLVNKLISDDSKETWVMIRFKPFPKNWKEKYDVDPNVVAGQKINEIVKQEKYKILNPKTTGLPVITAEKKVFFSTETSRLMALSIIITIFILAIALKSITGVVFPLFTSIGSMIVVFGMQGFLGIGIDPSLLTIPMFLGIAVSISYSIHIYNFFKRELKKTGERKKAVLYAVEESGWPILFTALTTIAALMSFLFVEVKTLRWIGLTTSVIVALTYLFVIILLPSFLSFGNDKAPDQKYIKKGGNIVERLMSRLSEFVMNNTKLIIVTFSLLTCIAVYGFTKLEISFDIRKTYGTKVPYVNRINEVANSKIGSLYSYNLAIEFDENGKAKEPDNLIKFDKIINKIKQLPLTKKTSSILDIIRDMNKVINNNNDDFYKIPESRDMIAQLLLLYENAGGSEVEKWIDYDYRRLRLLVEVSNYNSAEAKQELELIERSARKLFPDAQISLVGSIAQFTTMMDYVSWGQIYSFLVALVVIAVLMVLVFGKLKIGLIAMIPNIMPAIAVGGLMGYMDIPLDLMTVTIMPMLLGLAVDDTIHFINHSQLEFERTGVYNLSVRKTFITIGTALFYTSIVLILNFSAYITSVTNVFINIGILTGVGIAVALLTDYMVTPILIKWVRAFGNEAVIDEKILSEKTRKTELSEACAK